MKPTRLLAMPAPSHLPFALALAATAALVALGPRAAHPASQSYPLAGEKLTIYNLAGKVTLEPTSESTTRVEVTTGGADASRLKVETGPKGSRQTLRVVYPGDHVVYPELSHSRTTIRVRGDGTFGDDDTFWTTWRKVTISGSGGGVEAHADLRVFVPKGVNLLVRLAVGDVNVSRVEAKLAVDVANAHVGASGTKGDLSIDAGSGDVEVSDASGDLSIDTGSGRVRVSGEHGGELAIDTGSGEVEASRVEVDHLSVDTGSGGVELSSVKAPSLAVDTGSGDVRVELLSDVESLAVDTGSGSVEVRVPPELGARLSLDTGSGGFNIDLPLSDIRRDHGELEGRIGDGRGHITIETGSGEISILKR